MSMHVLHFCAQSDFVFLLSGDVITNVFLHHMADLHRDQDATVTILLQVPLYIAPLPPC